MSTTIDQKVVEMRFDNKQFETGAQTSISTLGKLKQSLNLSGASKGLEDISTAARRIDMNGLTSSVGTLSAKFSALQVAGVTALANITNSAVNAGKRIVAALTIDPIKTGFQEYETQINAVQTILANTESKGSTLTDVNNALDELNLYADKTIYNFTEMTRNIGTFTAAGVDLDTSVSAIKGIANLAAVSGSNSQQASTAMYQLSQALAAGTVKLMDWNSVVNAGMGGQVFQDALKETARVHGIKIDEMIKKEGSFRETLQNGWLSSEILTETLAKFTGDLTEEQLKSMGYTDEQIKKIMKMGQTANDAATKVKTFTQLFDTLKEAAQSGWTQTWEILIGDFEEAKALLTEISDAFSAIIGKSADSRNKLLQGWKDLGGRTDMIDSFRNAFEAIARIIKPISQAFREIFPQTTAEQLKKISEGIKNFTEKLKISEQTADKIKRTFKGVFSIFDIFRKALVAVGKVIASLFSSGGVTGLADLLLSITASIGDFFTSLNKGMSFDGVSNALSKVVSGISGLIKKAVGGLDGFADVLSTIGSAVAKFAKNIWNALGGVFDWIGDNVSMGDIFAGLAGGGVFLAAKKFMGLIKTIKEGIENLFGGKEKTAGLKENFSEVLGSVKNTLMSFTSGIRVASLLSIAASVAILSASLKTISKIKVPDLTKSLAAIGIMLGMLSLSFKSITKSLNKFPATGLVKAGVSMMLMAGAIKILAGAMVKMSSLSLKDTAKGLTAMGVGLAEMVIGLKAIDKVKIKISTSIAMLALAKSCQMLGDALVKFGGMSWGEIARGLAGMGGALAEFVIALNGLSKISGAKSILGSASLLIAVQSLGKLADGLKKFGGMSWGGIVKGLSGMGGALAEVVILTGALGKISGFSSIFSSIAIATVIQTLGNLADSFKKFAGMTWGEIIKGLSGMGGALAEVAVVTGGLGKIAGFSGILGSGAILIVVESLGKLAEAFKKFGGMSWDEIGKGLVGMGGALLEVAGISGALGKIAGFSGILGSGAILIAVQGLGKLADAFKQFAGLSWGEIARGLVGMGGALLEVAGISGGLGALTGLAGILGGAAIWTSVQGLEDLAIAFKKFGEMSWDEIKRGLAGMGSALGELAVGGLLNTFSIIGSLSISTMAEDLGVLADSLKKWSGVQVPENLGIQLGLLAKGVMQFTLGGVGSMALATCAEAVGTLATSVKKWTGVTVPEGIGDKMASLAAGVRKFTFSGAGALALASSAEAVGTLATSIKKWAGVTIPEDLGEGLKSIADGIAAFALAFVGGWSISGIIGPLGKLADTVTKWKNVTIPSSLKEDLSKFASGIKAFTWAFMGGWSLDTIVGPLGSLASSVKKWNGVTVPEGIGDQMTALAKGVKAFTWTSRGGDSLATIAGPLGTLANSVKKWSNISVPSDLTENLSSLASGVKKFNGIKDLSTAASGVSKIASAAAKMTGINFNVIGAGLSTFTSALATFSASGKSLSGVGNSLVNNVIKPITSAGPKLSNAGAKLVTSLANGIRKRSSAVSTSLNSVVTKSLTVISGKSSKFASAGTKMGQALGKGITKGAAKAKSEILKTLASIVTVMNGYYSHFYAAGSYVVDGFANGISANTYKARAKAKAMANAAEEAAKKALDERSPSKVFYKIGDFAGVGFVNGLSTYVDKARDVSDSMGVSAKKGLNDAISKINNFISGDLETRPTIRPVLDLDDVVSGARSLNGMLETSPAIGLTGSINTMMNRRIQNGANSDVISAINKLAGKLGNVGGDSYTINGVTYDDGSNVSDAVKTLVRAAKVERRV